MRAPRPREAVTGRRPSDPVALERAPVLEAEDVQVRYDGQVVLDVPALAVLPG